MVGMGVFLLLSLLPTEGVKRPKKTSVMDDLDFPMGSTLPPDTDSPFEYERSTLNKYCSYHLGTTYSLKSWWMFQYNGTPTPPTHPFERLLRDRSQPNRSRLFRSMCFDENREDLYQCINRHKCRCMKRPVLTRAINVRGTIRCVVLSENETCAFRWNGYKPITCHRGLWCDWNQTQNCIKCENKGPNHHPSCPRDKWAPRPRVGGSSFTVTIAPSLPLIFMLLALLLGVAVGLNAFLSFWNH
jgi:hypothetical protein